MACRMVPLASWRSGGKPGDFFYQAHLDAAADELRLTGMRGREHVSVQVGFGGVNQWRVEWSHWHPGAAAAAWDGGREGAAREGGREGGSALREQWGWLVGGGSLALW